MSEPRVSSETHKLDLLIELGEEHHVRVDFTFFAEDSLIDGLTMTHEGDKLPLSKVDDFLRSILSRIEDENLRCLLVCYKRVVQSIPKA